MIVKDKDEIEFKESAAKKSLSQRIYESWAWVGILAWISIFSAYGLNTLFFSEYSNLYWFLSGLIFTPLSRLSDISEEMSFFEQMEIDPNSLSIKRPPYQGFFVFLFLAFNVLIYVVVCGIFVWAIALLSIPFVIVMPILLISAAFKTIYTWCFSQSSNE